jgi:hypothetical protein
LLFRLRPLRFSFLARESISFPNEMAANLLRGAFGTVFRQIACESECPGARECRKRANCPYARIFEPFAAMNVPSGLLNLPRPFVFRTKHLDGVSLAAGERFHFDLNLFDVESPAMTYVALTFAQLAREGIGPGRKKVELTSVVQLNENADPSASIFERTFGAVTHNIPPLELSLSPTPEPVARVWVRFVTPTELKGSQQICTAPEFGILAARLRDRITTLRGLYGDGPLEMDFRAFGERAALVRMTRHETKAVNITRRSSRTGQLHPIGGFVGEAEYEGELAEFLPYLNAAKWTGVGRQTVWGKGEIQVEVAGIGNFPHKFPNNSRLPG